MCKSYKLTLIFGFIASIMFSLSGCTVNAEKTSSTTLLYGTSLLFSAIIPFCYILSVKKKNPWILLLFLCITTVNLGYLLLSCAKTLNFALWANRISYLGSVFLPICMLMSVLRLSYIKYKKYLVYILFILGFIVFLIAASPGYSTVYYKWVSLHTANGIVYLNKEYGPLHIVYLFYLLSYFISMIAIMVYSKIKHKLNDTLRAIFLIIAVFINIAVWFLEQLVHIEFELLSFSYIISEAFLLGVALLIQENEKRIQQVLKNNTENKKTIFSDDELVFFKRGIDTLTKTEKIIFNFYIEGISTKEIREKLSITENTLKYHNKNIYGKLGINSKKQLVEINNYINKN